MKYIGLVFGGILSAIGHMIGFVFKNIYISVRRFSMDPANKNSLWNAQAVLFLAILLLCFFWLVAKYQDLWYGSSPVFYRAIPLLLSCFLGHIIYSSPLMFRNAYAKPIIQTFLNTLSALALGHILIKFLPSGIGILIAFITVITVTIFTLYFMLKVKINRTIFTKLTSLVEGVEVRKVPVKQEGSLLNMILRKDKVTKEELYEFDGIDLNAKGCLSHLRYYSEECTLELFYTQPTKERQSQLVTLTRKDRAQHGQTLGGTGSGKTLLATTLIVQDLLNDYIGTTIIEPKGSLINNLANFMDRIGRPYHRLDAEYEFTSCLNPMYVPEGSDIEPMIEANVSAYHGYLGADAVQYFKSRTTQLLRVCMKALKFVYGNDCTYNELDRLVQPMNDDFRVEVLSEISRLGLESQVPLLREYTRNMAGSQKMQEHAQQTYSNLYDYLTELTSNKYIQRIFCGPSTFNLDEALERGEVILVNGAYGTLQTLTYTVGRLFLNLLRASTFRRNLKGEIRAHQLRVDEIEMFADEEFSTFMEMAREFEVFVDVIHQGNEQLTDVSKRLGAMVKQNAVQKFILAGLENEDADYVADMIGEKFVIGQSSGTDEMSTSGFKTQIKEEKRYIVEPTTIKSLRGFNTETGEAGEVLFRGVHNNERLDPVIGILLPLPKVLFSKLSTTENLVEEEEDKDVSEPDSNAMVVIQETDHDAKTDKLTKIKEKAAAQKGIMQQNENIEITREGHILEENEKPLVVRNTFWDSPAEEPVQIEEEIIKEPEQIHPQSKVKFAPASIDETTLRLAERIRQTAEDKRSNKGSSESE
ncbi:MULTISPECIES: type IV secretory system conjugative DNA transfer family protein [Paenibacillus]|uniref:type IV secretory system conjugative DNA transfer family protein n=1 Tax=Paenibacillus TaxID=44249 RepID=UPI00040047D1|nr:MULTISPECIES: type IV secretory system conjugative DNA transfer family protein [Paenibacillus]KGP77420.1 hypothetical protein P363_0133460 [Paenibacillus sp. MAEPY1]KGP78091.1 hypothetical protein P364_0129990 [Paenibacillus sp. MAEPY2]